ncbi:hypothetical protein NFHSH190041_30420 [Shewanella sp. NFH-SH190041]|nr:hypothetical protein NFHSH190041_30420 [Shewanella sp. NFH-SH190041]
MGSRSHILTTAGSIAAVSWGINCPERFSRAFVIGLTKIDADQNIPTKTNGEQTGEIHPAPAYTIAKDGAIL